MKPNAIIHNPCPHYLRGLRESVGYSQSAIADLLGISRRMIQYYESPEDAEGHRQAPYLYQYALECLAV